MPKLIEHEKELAQLVTGADGLLMMMRVDNRFDMHQFDRIMEILNDYYTKYKMRGETSNTVVVNCILLADALAGGSRFFDEKTIEMVEDASTELTCFFEGLLSEDRNNL